MLIKFIYFLDKQLKRETNALVSYAAIPFLSISLIHLHLKTHELFLSFPVGKSTDKCKPASPSGLELETLSSEKGVSVSYKKRSLSSKNIEHPESFEEENVPVMGSSVHQSILAMNGLGRPLSSSHVSSLGYPWAISEFPELPQVEPGVHSVPFSKDCPHKGLVSPRHI